MVIETRELGLVEISEEDILNFPDGIYGFEQIKEYVILKENNDDSILWLQAVSSAYPCFVILNPNHFLKDYRPELPSDVIEKLKANSSSELDCFVIAVIPENIKEMTVNLKSPVVVNFKSKTAMQVILEDVDYPIRYKVFQTDGKVG